MTARARRMLDALEDGCQTRHELWAHAGRFYLTNNAAADLRRAGIGVTFVRGETSDDDRYVLDEERVSPDSHSPVSSPTRGRAVLLVEHAGGQLGFEVAA